MLPEVTAAFVLASVCVVIHAAGLALAIGRMAVMPHTRISTGQVLIALVSLVAWLLALHLVEIAIWGAFLVWSGCLPDFETAMYFSGTTYSTVGYGDVLLPSDWRLLGPMEGLTGILMCGLSTGFFFAVITKLSERIPRGTR